MLRLTHPVTWTKPSQGYVKLNWDASIDKQQNRMGVGVFVCDHIGKALAMLYSSKEYM